MKQAFEAKRAEHAAEAFKKLDTNGDGQLSLTEFKAARGKTSGMHRHARGRFRHGMRGKGISKPSVSRMLAAMAHAACRHWPSRSR